MSIVEPESCEIHQRHISRVGMSADEDEQLVRSNNEWTYPNVELAGRKLRSFLPANSTFGYVHSLLLLTNCSSSSADMESSENITGGGGLLALMLLLLGGAFGIGFGCGFGSGGGALGVLGFGPFLGCQGGRSPELEPLGLGSLIPNGNSTSFSGGSRPSLNSKAMSYCLPAMLSLHRAHNRRLWFFLLISAIRWQAPVDRHGGLDRRSDEWCRRSRNSVAPSSIRIHWTLRFKCKIYKESDGGQIWTVSTDCREWGLPKERSTIEICRTWAQGRTTWSKRPWFWFQTKRSCPWWWRIFNNDSKSLWARRSAIWSTEARWTNGETQCRPSTKEWKRGGERQTQVSTTSIKISTSVNCTQDNAVVKFTDDKTSTASTFTS